MLLLKQAVTRDFLNWIEGHQAQIAKLFKRVYGKSGALYILSMDALAEAEVLVGAMIAAAPDKQNIIMSAAEKLIDPLRKDRGITKK